MYPKTWTNVSDLDIVVLTACRIIFRKMRGVFYWGEPSINSIHDTCDMDSIHRIRKMKGRDSNNTQFVYMIARSKNNNP
jgi:hypothetical protein